MELCERRDYLAVAAVYRKHPSATEPLCGLMGRVIREERRSIEKVTLLGWPVGKSWGIVLINVKGRRAELTVGGATSGQVVLGERWLNTSLRTTMFL